MLSLKKYNNKIKTNNCNTVQNHNNNPRRSTVKKRCELITKKEDKCNLQKRVRTINLPQHIQFFS